MDPTKHLNLPRPVFRVKSGKRYRFRVINAGSLFCPIRISIDRHSMLLIASDGKSFRRFEVRIQRVIWPVASVN